MGMWGGCAAPHPHFRIPCPYVNIVQGFEKLLFRFHLSSRADNILRTLINIV
jgi:hypothetical protein